MFPERNVGYSGTQTDVKLQAFANQSCEHDSGCDSGQAGAESVFWSSPRVIAGSGLLHAAQSEKVFQLQGRSIGYLRVS
ncbi:MAG: hypothetical protein QOE73_2535 [Verrucomicrobiota bacterium]